jgi:hypothetical protein
MNEKYYLINVHDINVGDMLCSRFNKSDKYLVLKDSIDLTLLELNTGRYFYPAPLDVVRNFMKVSYE